MEHDIELQLEKELAQLLHPEARLSYDENGNYWYMNHATKPMPNFLGYVPKWARDNAASFELMNQQRCFPIGLQGGVAVMDAYGEDRIAEEMYNDYATGMTEENTNLHAARMVILRASIYKQKLLLTSKKKGG